MRRIAARKRRTIEQANAERAAFLEECGACMYPNCSDLFGLAVHEVARGPSRFAALKHRELWLVLCDAHHKQLHRENWSAAKQLALRRLHFRDEDGRSLYCQVRGLADTAVTEREIQAAVEVWGLVIEAGARFPKVRQCDT